MDEKEIRIMSMLRKNARETLTRMSRMSNIPISTIYDRIKSQENSAIKKHTCILDFARLGFNSRASISIKVPKNKKEHLREYMLNHQNVNTIYKINNGYDFWIECIFKHIKDLEDFLEMLESDYGIKRQVYFIIDDIKREAFMSDPESIGLLM